MMALTPGFFLLLSMCWLHSAAGHNSKMCGYLGNPLLKSSGMEVFTRGSLKKPWKLLWSDCFRFCSHLNDSGGQEMLFQNGFSLIYSVPTTLYELNRCCIFFCWGGDSVSSHIDWEWEKNGTSNENQGPSQEEREMDAGEANNNCPLMLSVRVLLQQNLFISERSKHHITR